MPHTAPHRVHRPRWKAAGWMLLMLAVGLQLTVSSFTLAHWGIPYDQPGGSPLVKFHPASWVLALALGVALAAHGHPLGVLLARLRAQPLVAAYLAVMVTVGLWAVWRNGTSGAAFIVDTLWMPGVALLVLGLYGARHHRQLLGWMVWLLGLNALLALGEYALKQPLVPRYLEEQGLVAEVFFRSSALLGHPLANALVTVSLLPAVALAPAGSRWRWPLGLLLMLSLLAYGGRTALALALLVYGSAGAVLLALRAAHGWYSYRRLTGGLLAGLLTLTLVGLAVAASGLGERIFANFTWDNSANVRVVALNALDHMDFFDWWAGMSPERINQVAERIGLDTRYEAIENFWIVLLMQFGLIGFVPFLIGLGCAMWHLWRQASVSMRLAMPVYFIVASGANTLAAKSVSLGLLFTAMAASAAWRSSTAVAQPATARRPATWPRAPAVGAAR